jgi:hypothetical protein
MLTRDAYRLDQLMRRLRIAVSVFFVLVALALRAR